MIPWHILTSEYPPDIGGVSDYTRQVAEALVKTGEEVHVWCPRPTTARDGGVHIHTEFGRIRPADLRRLGDHLDAFSSPRRLLVQWVPHGFGYHSMNVWFCLWLFRRSRSGDIVELMVHEAYSDFRRGPLRHIVMACVQRFMTMVLLQTASRVWLSTPAWERRLRAYAMGRRVSMTWLPIPGCVSPGSAAVTLGVRRRYAPDRTLLIGHFGRFGADITTLLEESLLAMMNHHVQPSLLLVGSGSDGYQRSLLAKYPLWSGRVHAAGYLSDTQLAEHLAVCDLCVQPYPDGMTSRRTTALACLSLGIPVVTTEGSATEPMWSETGAVALATDAVSVDTLVGRLLEESESRRSLGARGNALYRRMFDVSHIVRTLKAA